MKLWSNECMINIYNYNKKNKGIIFPENNNGVSYGEWWNYMNSDFLSKTLIVKLE